MLSPGGRIQAGRTLGGGLVRAPLDIKFDSDPFVFNSILDPALPGTALCVCMTVRVRLPARGHENVFAIRAAEGNRIRGVLSKNDPGQ